MSGREVKNAAVVVRGKVSGFGRGQHWHTRCSEIFNEGIGLARKISVAVSVPCVFLAPRGPGASLGPGPNTGSWRHSHSQTRTGILTPAVASGWSARLIVSRFESS